MTASQPWDPQAEFAEAEQMGEGILLELLKKESLGPGFAPFSMSRFSVAPGCTTTEERHESRELWIIRSGQGELFYAGKAVRVAAGGVYLFQSEQPHSLRNTGAETIHAFSLWWRT